MRSTPMILAGLCALELSSVAAAQGDPNSAPAPMASPNGAMGANNGGADSTVSNGQTPAAPSPMSKADMHTMKACQAMSPTAMSSSSRCKAFKNSHPEMFNSDGSMKSDATPG